MKNMIVFALMTLVTVAASANRGAGADQEYPIFSCLQTQVVPDNTASLQVITGGFAGLTRIKLSVSTFAGPRSENFYVRPAAQADTPAGHVIYNGKNISLDITSDQTEDGGRAAVLTVQQGQNVHTIEMTCKQLQAH
jgi:hypothetical protein